MKKSTRQILTLALLVFTFEIVFVHDVFGSTCAEFWDASKALRESNTLSGQALDDELAALAALIDENRACLSWAIPTQNADGSPLTDLASYKVYYSMAAQPMAINSTIIDISDPTSDALETIFNITQATTYFFGITALDSSGNESAMSEIVSKIIRFVDNVAPNAPTLFQIELQLRQTTDGGEFVHP